jgi:hypothetical protein
MSAAPNTVISLVFAQTKRDAVPEVVVQYGDMLYTLEGLKKLGLLAVGPMEAIVIGQLADKMRGLALKLGGRA